MKFEEVLLHFDTVPYCERGKVLNELENLGQINAFLAEEVREHWAKEDDIANELCKEQRSQRAERGAYNLRGMC